MLMSSLQGFLWNAWTRISVHRLARSLGLNRKGPTFPECAQALPKFFLLHILIDTYLLHYTHPVLCVCARVTALRDGFTLISQRRMGGSEYLFPLLVHLDALCPKFPVQIYCPHLLGGFLFLLNLLDYKSSASCRCMVSYFVFSSPF